MFGRYPSFYQGFLGGLTRADWGIAALVGVLASGFCWLWQAPGIPPEAWEVFAEAASLRPPEKLFPGFWRLMIVPICQILGVAHTGLLLRALGFASGGLIAALAYLILREIQLFAMSRVAVNPIWFKKIATRTTAVCALVFSCSPGVWKLIRFYQPETQLALLMLIAVWLFLRFLRTDSLGAFALALFIAGTILAETALGIALFLFFVTFSWYFTRVRINPFNPLTNPYVWNLIKWRMTFYPAMGFLIVMALNIQSFQWFGGWESAGWEGYAHFFEDFILAYVQTFQDLTTLPGWFFGVLVCVGPFILSFACYRSSVDDEKFLDYLRGWMFILSAVTAISQLGFIQVLWFWPSFSTSPLLVGCLNFFSVAALALSFSVLTVNLYCRNDFLIGLVRYPEYFVGMTGLEINGSRDPEMLFRQKARRTRTALIYCLPILLILVCVIPRMDLKGHLVEEVIRDAVRAIVMEAGDAKWIFTDGRLDAGIELEAAGRGHHLVALNLVSKRNSRARVLALRNAVDVEDRLLLSTSAAQALRTWVEAKPNRVAECAFQLGLEAFNRLKQPLPPIGGFVARSGMTKEEQAAARELAESIEVRIRQFYRRYTSSETPDGLLGALFEVVQWRLSRCLRLRAEEELISGNMAQATSLQERIVELERSNRSLQRLMARLNWMSSQEGDNLSPREGLLLSLKRADFKLAQRYATAILGANPDDADANFAMGMRYLLEANYCLAAEHFSRVLKIRPKEVAVLNNLAIVRFKQGRLEEAQKLAEEANRIRPNSREIMDTLLQIRNAIQK